MKALALLLALSSFGCATMLKGSTDTVTVTSQPPGASVAVNGTTLGTTPFTTELKTNQPHTIDVVHDGVKKSTLINNKTDGVYIVLDIVTGVVPLIVDAATGNWNKLVPRTVHVVFDADTTRR